MSLLQLCNKHEYLNLKIMIGDSTKHRTCQAFFGHIKFLGTTFKGRHQKWYSAEAERGFTEKRPPFLQEDIPK